MGTGGSRKVQYQFFCTIALYIKYKHAYTSVSSPSFVHLMPHMSYPCPAYAPRPPPVFVPMFMPVVPLSLPMSCHCPCSCHATVPACVHIRVLLQLHPWL